MTTKVLLFILTLLVATSAAPAKPLSLAEAESRLLEAYDAQEPMTPLPEVGTKNRRALRWLEEAATKEIPANPFRKGSAAWREAESIRRLPSLPDEAWPQAIANQPLTLNGSRLAFWRWGKLMVRQHRMSDELRVAWEDRILGSHPPELLYEYALRHSLCFALAQANEARFSSLKEQWSDLTPDLFLQFQRAFALLRAPSPTFTLWKLPEMTKVDVALPDLGAKRIWIAQSTGKDLVPLSEGTAWIIPTKEGLQPLGQNELVEPSLGEARTLAARLKEANRTAYLAPIQHPFETYALVFFPILVELSEDGTIASIEMGDAALVKEP